MENDVTKDTIRLDKYLADMGMGTRTEVKVYIKKGRIAVNGEIIKQSDCKISISEDKITFDGHTIGYVSQEYFMLNKPSGCISATSDPMHPTVVDLILDSSRKDLFPVGRLDRDTEGLLIITNDGELAHNLLSPKKHIGKTYFAVVDGVVTNADVQLFKNGVEIEEGFTTSAADLTILKADEQSEVTLTIYEGRFHQVKRMFHAAGKEVTYLKRLSMGSLTLDPNLQAGEYRELTKEELDLLKKS